MDTGNYTVERLTGNCVAGVLENLYLLSVETDLSVENTDLDLTPAEGRQMRRRSDNPLRRGSDTHPDRERMTSTTESVNS